METNRSKKFWIGVAGAALFVAGFALGWKWLGARPKAGSAPPEISRAAAPGVEAGMPNADSNAAPPPADRGPVQVSARQAQLIGLATARAEYRSLDKTIRTVGRVDIDETRTAHVHTRVSGWVRDVYADYTWQHVHKGDPLLSIYSPDLVATEEEYLLALKARQTLGSSSVEGVAAGAGSLLEAARKRLLLWGVTEEQVQEIEKAGQAKRDLMIYSPVTGHVMERKVFPDQYITPDSDLYTIVDHTRVWIYANIYESDIGFVRLGQAATVTVDAFPGQVFRGRVSFIAPHLDMATRTLEVRMDFPNPDLKFKPEMYTNVELHTPLGRRLVVPDSAVMDTGTRQLVFVQTAPGAFEPRDVRLGARAGGLAEVLKGLKAGEQVAATATFLIDSESQLRSALEGMTMGTGVTEIGGRPAAAGPRLQIAFRTEPQPPRAGTNDAVATVRNAAGKPVEGAVVKVICLMPAMPSMGMAAMRAEAELNQTGSGEYRGALRLPTSGTWQVTVSVAKDGKPLGAESMSVTAEP